MLSILLAVSGAFSVTAWRRHHPPGADATVRKFSLTPPVALAALYGDLGSYAFPGTSTAISPNGKHIAFTDSDARLWIQDLDRNEPRAIEGADGAALPFWSPDSQFIGFFVGRELKKVSVHGGPATTLCELPGPIFRGGTWSPDGSSIVFSSGQATPRLYEVLARGGSPELFIEPAESEQDANFHWPHFLPLVSDEAVLMFAQGSGRQHEIVIQELRTGLRQVLGPGTSPVYSPTGHIVFLTSPSIADTWALPFSLETLKATGEAFPVDQASYWPSVSGDGTLVYLDTSTSGQMQLVWRDRRGGKIGEIGQPQPTISEPALSPDGRFVAVSASEGSLPDMWIQDISRAVKSRLSFSPEDESRPVWSPDGKHVAYSHRHSGQSDILVKPADGSGEAQALVATEALENLLDWSLGGKFILYEVNDPKTGSDLWYLERKPDGSGYESHPFLQTPFAEGGARFSPDGRFVAYCSNESGRVNVYVRPFPEGGARWQVSSKEGRQPRWRRDGKEIFYVEGDALIAVSTRPGFSVGKEARLFQNPTLPWTLHGFAVRYDVSPDGQRFVLRELLVEEDSKLVIRVVQNWFEEFRDGQRER